MAVRAGVSQDTVSRIERGQLGPLQLRTVRAVLTALEMEMDPVVRWRGGDLDRLADEGHAALVARVTRVLVAAGWTLMPEVSFSHFGDRGSIDVLAWHAEARVLLVVEVKTTLNSIEETLRRHDVKVRIARAVAAERFGWQASNVVPLLVLPAMTSTRVRVARTDDVLRVRYPVRGRAVGAWLQAPDRASGGAQVRGLLAFLRPTLPGRTASRPVARKRIRTPFAPPMRP